MDKIIFPLLLICLFQTMVYSQTFNAIHLSIGQLNGQPNLSENEDWIWRAFPERFTDKKGMFSEAMVFMEIKPKFNIGTGIHYSQLKFRHEVFGIKTGEDLLNGTTTSISKLISLQNIGIPVQAGYNIFDKKLKVQAHAGILALKAFTKSSKTKVTGAGANDPVIAAQGFGKTSDIKGISFSTFSGLELSYPITKNILVKISGRLQWYFFSKNDYYENAKGNIFAKGISVGIGYRIK